MKAPRLSPVACLFVTAIAVTLALGWFGWKLFSEQQATEKRRRSERLENAADTVAAEVRGKLAETSERLSTWFLEGHLPVVDNAVVFGVAGETARVSPPGALPFDPRPAAIPKPQDARLRHAMALEYASGNPASAIEAYRRLSMDPNPGIRAAALLGLGGVLRNVGDTAGALESYRRLATLKDTLVDGYPAELAALDGERLTLLTAGKQDEAGRLAAEIVNAIDEGRWALTRETAASYRKEFTSTEPRESWHLAGALADLWAQWKEMPTERGVRVALSGDRPVMVVWRARGRDVAALAAFPDRFLPLPSSGLAVALRDPNGLPIVGTIPPAGSAERLTGDMSSPWTVHLWENPPAPAPTPMMPGSALVVAVALTAILFLWSAVYFTARAMQREVRATRLQSDFVAAVSHEFRSPLTTIRHLSELLQMGDDVSAPRRLTYYELLVRESGRLQRLVETLLKFGKMEAGAERYKRDQLNVSDLIRRVVLDVEAHRQDGPHIELTGTEDPLDVLGDADALALALRNLLDNAIKYSPGTEVVRVEWRERGGQASIRVIDQGVGIDPSERDAIFARFVRGRAAAAIDVKGTGIGLAMVQDVIAAHGGHISVESVPGQGSTFTVSLPALG